MKTKIVFLPLDERPCNHEFPTALFSHEDLQIVQPERLGYKKKAANRQEIEAFLLKECRDADGLVLSLDMLIYGGLIPSRIHGETADSLKKNLEILSELKKENPDLPVYAFQVIMRCPDYSSSDEEPDYYEDCGKEIHLMGEMIHKSRLGITRELGDPQVMPAVPPKDLEDYISRRQTNLSLNKETLKYLENGAIDFLVIPQDDSARYGYAAMDQETMRQEILLRGLSGEAVMYPGADEVGLTLLSRMLNRLHHRKPKVYVKYACEQARFLIPLFEGNALSGTIKSHVYAAGCQLTDSYEYADILLAVTASAGKMQEASRQPCAFPEYGAERNLPELIDFICERKAEGKIVSIVDNAYANGGDLEFFRLLDKKRLLLKVDGYAGWNTSANSLGTALAEGIDACIYGRTPSHMDFIVRRYIEDVGYCAVVRKKVTGLLQGTSWNYFDVGETSGAVAALVEKELREFLKESCGSIADSVWLEGVFMPWKRMFEVGFRAGLRRQTAEGDM